MTTASEWPSAHDSLAWDAGKLRITDPALVEKIRRPALSPSSAQSMEKCPSRWVGDRIMRGPADAFAQSDLGTSTHSVLEDFYELPVQRRTPDQATLILLKLADEQFPIDPNASTEIQSKQLIRRTNWITEVSIRYRGIFDIEDPQKVMVARTERKVEGVELNGVPFIGIIDRTDMLDEEHGAGLGIVDYKAGRVAENIKFNGDGHGDQLRLYTLAVEQADGRMPTSAIIYYVRHSKSKKVALSKARLNDTLSRFRTSWDRLNRSLDKAVFDVEVTPLCGWCPLVASCPAAQSAGKVAKINAPTMTDLGIPVLRKLAEVPEPPAEVITERDFPVDDEAPDMSLEEPPNDEEPPYGEDDAPLVIDVAIPGPPALTPVPNSPQTTTESVPESGDADVIEGVGQTHTSTTEREAALMSNNLIEGKPWEPVVGNGLNPTSYSSMAVFGLVELAVDSLNEAGQDITGSNVTALSQTFAKIACDVQEKFTAERSFQEGMNTRARGALRTALKTMPVPFGGAEADFDAWVDALTRRTLSIATAAVNLYANAPAAQPWKALAIAPAAKAA